MLNHLWWIVMTSCTMLSSMLHLHCVHLVKHMYIYIPLELITPKSQYSPICPDIYTECNGDESSTVDTCVPL